MRQQLQISFLSPSPINTLRLTGQNKKLYEWLMAGNNIHCMSEDMNRLGIGYLNSRISDLKKAGVTIEKKFIDIEVPGEKVKVKLYWLSPESIKKLEGSIKQAA